MEPSEPPRTTYTISLTARACLQALRLAAWIEAMVIAYRAVHPGGVGWLWFLGRCFLFTLGAYAAISVAAEIAKRRGLRGGVRSPDTTTEPREAPPADQPAFDRVAFDAAAAALLFHFGTPLWMWIFA